MSRKNTQSGNISHHRITPPHVSSTCEAWRQKHMKAAAPQTASTIHMASSYGYLKQLYEKVSDDPGGNSLTFQCKLHLPGFKKQLQTSTTSTANLKWYIELKHPASLSRSARVDKKSRDTTTMSQNRSSTTQITLTAYSSYLHLPVAAGLWGTNCKVVDSKINSNFLPHLAIKHVLKKKARDVLIRSPDRPQFLIKDRIYELV